MEEMRYQQRVQELMEPEAIDRLRERNLTFREIYEYEEHRKHLRRSVVYNDLPAICIDTEAKVTTETRRQADLFFERIRQGTGFRSYKLLEKQRFFQALIHAVKIALWRQGCLMIPRNLNHPDCTKARLQVIDASTELGLFREYRSPKGSPKMSRLLPLEPLVELTSVDPWTFDKAQDKQYVFLIDRDSEEEILVPRNHPVVKKIQHRLELINHVNSSHVIRVQPDVVLGSEEMTCPRRLRPIHYARFTNDFEHHGRLYTGKYGHQSLPQRQRKSISFDGEPCVELNFSGMHPRMLYHLEGLDFREDPYRLWGADTSPGLRLLAKVLVNTAINAQTKESAISACNYAMCTKTKSTDERGKSIPKTGASLRRARELYDAYQQANVRFEDVYALALQHHAPIAKYFGSDYGIKLMRLDSQIALNVMAHFAKHQRPCLSCHDSFLVPRSAEEELRHQMVEAYVDRLGFPPIIK